MRALLAITLALIPVGLAAAENDGDAPPPRVILGKSEAVMRDGQPYRVSQPEQVSKETLAEPNIYIESKFEAFAPPDRAKVAGLNGVLLLNDSTEALKAAKALKHGESLWCCGTLQLASDHTTLEVRIL